MSLWDRIFIILEIFEEKAPTYFFTVQTKGHILVKNKPHSITGGEGNAIHLCIMETEMLPAQNLVELLVEIQDLHKQIVGY